jgi:hypothetical protein
MPMLEIFTKIISHPITWDQLINLKNVDTNGIPSILLAIQTWIAINII